jgi:carbon monoxide dehydrogenase subunit G
MIIRERLVIARPLGAALALFDDVPDIVGCIPGARVIGQNADGSYAAVISAKYGEVGVQFSGTLRGDRTAPDTLRVRAEGSDGRNVGAVGDIRLTFAETEGGMTTVEIAASLSFTGMFTAIAYSATKVVGPKLMRGFAEGLAAKAAVAEA